MGARGEWCNAGAGKKNRRPHRRPLPLPRLPHRRRKKKLSRRPMRGHRAQALPARTEAQMTDPDYASKEWLRSMQARMAEQDRADTRTFLQAIGVLALTLLGLIAVLSLGAA